MSGYGKFRRRNRVTGYDKMEPLSVATGVSEPLPAGYEPAIHPWGYRLPDRLLTEDEVGAIRRGEVDEFEECVGGHNWCYRRLSEDEDRWLQVIELEHYERFKTMCWDEYSDLEEGDSMREFRFGKLSFERQDELKDAIVFTRIVWRDGGIWWAAEDDLSVGQAYVNQALVNEAEMEAERDKAELDSIEDAREHETKVKTDEKRRYRERKKEAAGSA